MQRDRSVSESVAGVWISENFITQQMLSIRDQYIKIYLYARYLEKETGDAVSVEALCAVFKDRALVESALRELSVKNCLLLSDDGQVFFAKPKPDAGSLKPNYTQSQISASVERDAQLQMLMQAAEQVLGKMLTASAATCLYGLYDWLGMSPDVILKLLEYCVEIGKRNMAYIEKVAIAWHQNGINTVSAAEVYIAQEMQKRSFVYMAKRIFGIDNRNFSTREVEYLRQWSQMGISEALLAFAFDYTVDNTGKLSFAYMHKVLTEWNNAGVKTPLQAKRCIETYRQAADAQQKTASVKRADKAGIYDSKTYDYEQIRRQARKKIRQELGKE